MKKEFLLFLFILAVIKLLAQDVVKNNQIGNYFDINGQPIFGFYDNDYIPEKSLQVSHYIGADYTPGYYYDLNSNKIEGFIKYSQYAGNFEFKPDMVSKKVTLNPKNCLSFVIRKDSIVSIQNFAVQLKSGTLTKTKPEFAVVLDVFDGMTFYKHTTNGSQNPLETFLLKYDGAYDYKSFPKKDKKFIKYATQVFKDYPFLVQSISNGTLVEKDMPSIIKILKYAGYFEKHKPICFNSSWDEVEASENYSYFAEIQSFKDSVFHLKYFLKDSTPLFEGDFTGFYPHRQKNKFVYYYPNGTIRKTIEYRNNNQNRIQLFYKTGNLQFQYSYFENTLFIEKALTENGEEKLDSHKSGAIEILDGLNQRTINYSFVQGKLNAVYYLDTKGRKIYQYCQQSAEIKNFKSVQNKLNLPEVNTDNALVAIESFSSKPALSEKFRYPKAAVDADIHGFVLVKCLVETDGRISDYKLVKGISTESDAEIVNKLSDLIGELKWRSAKVDDVEVPQEVILPIDFSIVGFSRYRTNYYGNRNYFWNPAMNRPYIPAMKPPTMAPAFRF